MELLGRRVRPGIAAVLLFVALPAAAWASHSGPDDGDQHDYVTGQAQILIDIPRPDAFGDTVNFDVVTGPNENAHGDFVYQVSGPASTASGWKGHVDCFVVYDNVATFGGNIIEGGSGRFAVRTRDNGVRDGTDADLLDLRYGGQTAGDCSGSDFAQPDQLTLLKGEVTVRDHRF